MQGLLLAPIVKNYRLYNFIAYGLLFLYLCLTNFKR